MPRNGTAGSHGNSALVFLRDLHRVESCVFFLKVMIWDFLGGPMVKTPGFHYREPGFDPWSRN